MATLTASDRRRLDSARRRLAQAAAQIDAVRNDLHARPHSLFDSQHYTATQALARAADAAEGAVREITGL